MSFQTTLHIFGDTEMLLLNTVTPRQRTNILISFFRKLDVNIPLQPSQRHILSILFDYDFVTTSEKLMKITGKIFKRNLGKRMICSQIILTTTKNKNDERAEESREICFSGIGGIVSTLNRYLDDTVEPVITDTQPEVIGPQIGDMNFRRSKKVSKRRSKKVSKRRSKKVSKRRSKKVFKRRSKKVFKRRSKKVSKRRSKKLSKRSCK
jgi:hypothetical protein